MNNFAGVRASDDARGAFSHQLNALKATINDGTRQADAIYVEAERIRLDFIRYNSWDSSWAPIRLGGYYSSEYISNELNRILREYPISVAREVSTRTSGPAASADPVGNATNPDLYPISQTMERDYNREEGRSTTLCEEQALESFGPIFGRSKIATLYTCHKTKLIIGGIVSVVGLVMLHGFISGVAGRT